MYVYVREYMCVCMCVYVHQLESSSNVYESNVDVKMCIIFDTYEAPRPTPTPSPCCCSAL